LRPDYTPATISGGNTVTGIEVQLSPWSEIGPRIGLSPSHGSSNGPVIYWGDEVTLMRDSCAYGSASYVVSGNASRFGSMTEAGNGTGHYVATLPRFLPATGVITIEITVNCPDSTVDSTSFDVYIDPSGRVSDTEGNPIQGATVTLFRSDTIDGTYLQVPANSLIMKESNRRNPDTTDANGLYGWDVKPGYYKVKVEKSGYVDDVTGNSFAVSGALTIPPPRFDVNFRLRFLEKPILALTKSASPATYSAVGQAINYTLVATNNGNVALNNVSINDPKLSALNCDQPATLSVGASLTCTGSYTITQTDMNNGSLTNTANASGRSPQGHTVSASASATVTKVAQCSTPSSIQSNFNGTTISPSNYIWFNSNFSASGIQNGSTLSFTNSTLSVVSKSGTQYSVAVPDATITFSSSASCASTSFSGGKWVTTIPVAGSDEIFLSGLLVKASTITGSSSVDLKSSTITWTGSFGSNTSGLKVNWKWGAAVYSASSAVIAAASNPNQIGVKPTHTNACNFTGSDHAGTPMSLKQNVVGGARGGGGSNYTGSWSGTGKVTPCAQQGLSGNISEIGMMEILKGNEIFPFGDSRRNEGDLFLDNTLNLTVADVFCLKAKTRESS
jgi:uncharacterized repeat protein (TIGR01451 family)